MTSGGADESADPATVGGEDPGRVARHRATAVEVEMLVRRGIRGAVTAALSVVLSLLVAASTAVEPRAHSTPVASPRSTADVVARYRHRIPELMAEQGVPGLAVAVVDRARPVWVEGFGHLDGTGSAPVDANTLFSVQSTSKVFTATAVMQAVAAGRIDLDAPITRYLPGFTVHSAFEKHPERKITIRMLLSHTAGFTHEAPVGNNDDLAPGTFDAHVRSISDTWLRFPVGTGYAYSNLGIDLAGYVLERVEGEPFAQVLRDSLLGPLGMRHSTLDRTAIRAARDRAVGHVPPYPAVPVVVPMTAAGGLWTSASDLARFLRFELDGGRFHGRSVLDPEQLREMRTVVYPSAGAPAGYALGVVRHRWNRFDGRPDLFEHGGGGFGFLSDLWWSPQLGLGIAVLTSSQDHHLQGDLALSILTDLVTVPGVYRDRLSRLPIRAPVPDPMLGFEPPASMPRLVAGAAMPASRGEHARWAAYVGRYRMSAWGVLDPTQPPSRFVVAHGTPYLFVPDDVTGPPVRHRLTEVEPGVFLADNGETLDMRGRVATWASIRLVRVSGGPAAWQWAVLGTAAALAGLWLVLALARGLTNRRRGVRRSGPSRVLPAAVATAAALLVLGTGALLVAWPGLVDSGFLGWLDFPLPVRLALHLPTALVVAAAGTAVVAAAGWRRRWWSREVLVQHAVLALGAVVVAAQVLAWGLVGWGFT